MPDPSERHAVCPDCHTHQLQLPDGRLAEHVAEGVTVNDRCPGSEDYPNRAAATGSRYSVTSNFASCPAATGEADCTDFPDHAHRCGLARGHARDSFIFEHRCTCGSAWRSSR